MSDFVLYRFWKGEQLLYVGMSIKAYQRFTQHQATSVFFHEASNITMDRFTDLESLRLAEIKAIKTENPVYNVARPKIDDGDVSHCCVMHAELLSARAKVQHERLRESGLVWGVDVGLTSSLSLSVVTLIIELRDRGLSLGKIAMHLNTENIPTSRGAQWRPNSVLRILNSPRAKILRAEMKR